MFKRKKFRYTDENGKTYRFNDDDLTTAWRIVEQVDKIDTASLYLMNYCKLKLEEFTNDEWWLCCATLCGIYAEKMGNGANDAVWKSACDEFVEMYKKGEVI